MNYAIRYLIHRLQEKQALLEIIENDASFCKTVFGLKQKLEELQGLEERKESLINAMTKEITDASITFVRDQDLLKNSISIREEWKDMLSHPRILDDFERLYLNKTNVVFATCTGIASSDNGNFDMSEYDYVIVDEAAKCNMLDLLIPLVMGKKMILVGDHKQLYPILETEGLDDEISEEQMKELKEHTLFKWLFEERIPSDFRLMLNKQYRMPYDISQFASEHFYNNELESEKKPDNNTCMFWIDIPESCEKQKGHSTSYYNEEEADVVLKLMRQISNEANYSIEVGIVCTYKAQASYINNSTFPPAKLVKVLDSSSKII